MGRICIAAVTRRKLRVASDVEATRLAICGTCPKLDRTLRQCGQCGCFVDWKAPWATETCPLGKWKKELFNTTG